MTIRKHVPASGSVTSVEFTLRDSAHPFVAVSADGGEVLLQEIIPRGGGEYGEFFSIVGRDAEEVMRLAERHGSVDAELLVGRENGGVFEFVVSENCPAVFLGEQGALPRHIESVDGEGRIVVEIPEETDASAVIDRFLDTYPDAELARKRQQPFTTPVFSHREFCGQFEESLTERQREVLTTAHEAGYYEWPRETTGEELAERLDISTPTLHEHLRTAEQKLVALVFENALTQAKLGWVT